jgi:hypothetical protein
MPTAGDESLRPKYSKKIVVEQPIGGKGDFSYVMV